MNTEVFILEAPLQSCFMCHLMRLHVTPENFVYSADSLDQNSPHDP